MAEGFSATASTSTTIPNKNIKIKILDIERREEYAIITGIVIVGGETKMVVGYVRPTHLCNAVVVGEFHLLCNSRWNGPNFNLNAESKILKGKPFPYDIKIEELFVNPKTATVQEALASPEKTKANVRGVLKSSTGILTSSKSVRRCLYITPEDTGYPILDVTLWGDKSKLDVPPDNTPVIVKNLEIRSFRDKKTGNSTSQTSIEIYEEKERLVTGVLEGFSSEERLIFIDDNVFHLENDTELHTIENYYKNDTEVILKVKGNKVQQITNNAKRVKKDQV